MSAGAANRSRGALQLLAPFLLLAAIGFGLPAWIYSERIGQALRETERSRLQFTLADLKADFEQGLAQGYGIRDLANAQPALEAEARLDPSIDAIAVLAPDGAVVNQTGAVPHGAPAPTVATPLVDAEGKPAGQLGAWIGERAQQSALFRARVVLALAALAATLFTATAAMAVMAWLARRRDEVLEAIAEGLEHPGRPGDPRTDHMVDEVNQRVATTMVGLTAARHLAQQGEP